MRHFDAQLHANQCTGDRRVNISYDQHPIRLFSQDYWLEAFHDCSCLHRMGSGTNSEVNVWLRQVKIGEESIRHRCVVMLTRVDYKRKKVMRTFLHSSDNRRHFHEVWPGANDVDYL